MTFKPGMHQNCDAMRVDFDAVIAKMASAQPQATYPMKGWGKKFFIRATVARKSGDKTEIEFYTELTFPEKPSNRSLGYTKEDATLFQGVQVVEVAEDGTNQGEIYVYLDFVDRFISDSSTRITLERVMEGMRDNMAVTEQTIERINTAWGNRNPGDKLYSVPYQ